MSKLRTGGIIAGAAFLLSFLIGIVSRTSMPLLLVRPVIFAVLFFVISVLVGILVNRFMPELLDEGGFEDAAASRSPGQSPRQGPESRSGSRINIIEEDYDTPIPGADRAQGSDSPGPFFMGAQPDDSDENLGDISELTRNAAASLDGEAPGGMDQNAQDGYTGTGGEADFSGLIPGGKIAGDPFSAETYRDEAPPGKARPAGTNTPAFMDFSNSDDALPDLDSMAEAFLPATADEESDTADYSVSLPSKKPSSGGKNSEWKGDFNAKDMAAGLRTILSKDKEG